MQLSTRDAAVPPDEVPPIVKELQIDAYFNMIPAAILVYDSRAFSLRSYPLF